MGNLSAVEAEHFTLNHNIVRIPAQMQSKPVGKHYGTQKLKVSWFRYTQNNARTQLETILRNLFSTVEVLSACPSRQSLETKQEPKLPIGELVLNAHNALELFFRKWSLHAQWQ